jgi:hypothetical protein
MSDLHAIVRPILITLSGFVNKYAICPPFPQKRLSPVFVPVRKQPF